MRPTGTADELEARRRRVVKLLGSGWAIKDVAAALGVSRQSVSTWKARAGSRGEKAKALAAKPQHVPVCRLSKPRQELVACVLARTLAFLDGSPFGPACKHARYFTLSACSFSSCHCPLHNPMYRCHGNHCQEREIATSTQKFVSHHQGDSGKDREYSQIFRSR